VLDVAILGGESEAKTPFQKGWNGNRVFGILVNGFDRRAFLFPFRQFRQTAPQVGRWNRKRSGNNRD